jgi:hypothetical protein
MPTLLQIVWWILERQEEEGADCCVSAERGMQRGEKKIIFDLCDFASCNFFFGTQQLTSTFVCSCLWLNLFRLQEPSVHEQRQHSRYSDWLWAGCLRGRSSSHSRIKNFNFSNIVQPSSVVHPTSYPMGTGESFPKGKAAGMCWPLTSN